MFQKFFITLYEALLGPAAPPSLIPVYQGSVFPGVGLGTLFGVSLGVALMFYLVLNRLMTTAWYKTSHWFVMLLLVALGSAGLAWSQARSVAYEMLANSGEQLGSVEQAAYDRYVLGFLVVNALYGALFFVLWSFILKAFSTNARTTPVRWPS